MSENQYIHEFQDVDSKKKKEKRRETTDAFTSQLTAMNKLLDEGIDEFDELQDVLDTEDDSREPLLNPYSPVTDPLRNSILRQSPSQTLEQKRQDLLSQGKHGDAAKLGG